MNIFSEISVAHQVAYTVSPRGFGLRRRRRAHAASLALTVASSGGTTLEGRVLRADDDVPLQGVTLRIGAVTTQTDAAGRFFFASAPAGTQILMIDGTTVTSPPGTYHTLPAQVNLVANQANVLPFVSYLPLVDTTVKSHIDPATTSVIQDPRVPGLSFTIPTGTELRSDLDGSLITDVAITPVSPSRIPLPQPGPGLHIDPGTIYMMYFFKPGGAIPSQKITQFALPNDLASAPGRNIIFYYFDSSPTVQPGTNQWKLAGTGKISADGKLALPDPGVGFPKFCCALIFWCNAEGATEGNLTDDKNTGADPVDLGTGQFVRHETDFTLAARLPIAIERGYQEGRKSSAGPFGKGTFFNFEKQAQPTESGLVITYAQGNGRIDLLTRQPDGTFQSTSIASLQDLVLTPNADGSKKIRRKDGSIERYNTTGRLIGLEDRNGNTITIERGVNDQIIRIVDASGIRALTFQYDANDRIQQITDPINRTVQYAYTGAGYLDTVTDPAGGITRYTYDANGSLLTIVDPRNILYLTNEYDTAGRVIRQTLADGGVYLLDYQTFGTTIVGTTVTDPRGKTTTSRFNAQGYTANTTDGVGQPVRKTLNQSNQPTEIRDAQNRVTKNTYDAAGNVTSTLDPQGNPTLFEYEPVFNRVTKITDALNQITRFTYDPANGNLLSTIDPLTHATSTTYNQFGQSISVTDALNHTTTFEYDEIGNLIVTIDPLGNRTLRFYDAISRLIGLIDPRGKTTQFTYDALNRVTQIQDASNGIASFTYDPNGNLLTVTDAKNQTTTYTYDNTNRLATKRDALNRTESYQYDLAGNLSQFTDRKNQVTTFQYDALNRRIGATYADSTTTFTYDSVGRLTKASDTAPGAGAIEFGYDILNRLIQETTGQGTVNYQYDVLGRRTQIVANGQQPTIYQYDPASRLTRVEQGALFAALGYDNANRRAALSYSNGTTTSYAYDVVSRLTNITHNGPGGIIEALTYQYDAAGNRTSLTRSNGTASLLPAAVTSATYDAANEQIAFAGATRTYDANGNLTNDGANTYQWDARNRLIAISGPSLSASFSYDALGRRVSKTINGVASMYHYDQKDIVMESQGSAVVATYLRKLCLDIAFIRQTSSGSEYYHADALDSSLVLTNATGAATDHYQYEPFGTSQHIGTSTNPFQFTGREGDTSELFYYRARYYGPRFGRFLSEDPIRLNGGGTNFYMYVQNNPIRFIDPLGLVCTSSLEEIRAKCYPAFQRFPDEPNILNNRLAYAEYQFRSTNFMRSAEGFINCDTQACRRAWVLDTSVKSNAKTLDEPNLGPILNKCLSDLQECVEYGKTK